MRSPAPGFEIVRVAVLVLLLVVLGLALLYAYRSQTPSQPEVDLSQALQDINSGRVRAITIVANKATLEFRDSPARKEQATLPQPDSVLAPAVAGYNATHPSQPIEIRYMQDGQTFGVIGAIFLSLLPVFLIGAFFYYLLIRARGRS
jgi:ATP-dependent Zn protease